VEALSGYDHMVNLHIHQRESINGQSIICQLDPAPGAPADARELVRDSLVRLLDGPSLQDALLATSELVTNAVKYGDGSPLWLHLKLSDDRLAITVTSGGASWTDGQGPQTRLLQPSGCDDRLDEGGRGLPIVCGLAGQVALFLGSVTIVRVALDVSR